MPGRRGTGIRLPNAAIFDCGSRPSIGRMTDVRIGPHGQPASQVTESVAIARGGSVMATFMDVHNGFFGVTGEQLAEAHGRDLAIEGEEGVHYERAWLDPVSGKVFCLAT